MKIFAMVVVALGFSSLTLLASAQDKPAGVPPTSAPNADAAAKESPGGEDTVKVAKVHFVSPQDGATIPQKSTFKFSVDGLKATPAGRVDPGTGHFHLLVDTPATKEGEKVPKDSKHMHFAKGQSEAEVTLAPGQHTLTLQFADGAHHAYNPMMTQTIKVTVK